MTQNYIFSAYYHLIVVDGCPFCEEALSLLNDAGVAVITENATEQKEWLREQKEIYNWKTVPIINKVQVRNDNSIDVEFIGGYTDLMEHMNIDITEDTTEETTQEEAEAATDIA